ncbi:MAG: hypothetical protein ACRC67_18145 [Inquilinus sp.]|uniref:hypothetical protein n=1 Tax=Inquilinus sp. TaxID=1932117 RepID=UPI003F33A514
MADTNAPAPADGIDLGGVILSVEGAEPEQLPDHSISVLNDVCVERVRMIVAGATPATDDGIAPGLWHDRLLTALDQAEGFHRAGMLDRYRSTMLEIAAMTCAAVERHDRIDGTVPDLSAPRQAAGGAA